MEVSFFVLAKCSSVHLKTFSSSQGIALIPEAFHESRLQLKAFPFKAGMESL